MSKNRIEELSPHQLRLLEEYRDKWLRIGLSTDPCDRTLAEHWATQAYLVAGLDAPKSFVWSRSPLECALISIQVGAQVRAQVGAQIKNRVWNQVGAQVRAQVWDQVWNQVGAQVRAQVGDQVRDQVGAQVGSQVRNQVWDQVRAQVKNQVWAQVGDQVRDQVYGAHDADWLGFYNFFLEVCSIETCERLVPLMELAKNCGWWAPYKDICFLQEKPSEIHFNSEKQLHMETGPAILYQDGLSVYSLNGVRLNKEIVETPADQLSCQLILSENNAEIRREIVRKIGLDRIIGELGAVIIDSRDGYELFNIKLGDKGYRPYLKMVNPSIGVNHIEGVHPSCKTVSEALAWRNGLKVYSNPEVLT